MSSPDGEYPASNLATVAYVEEIQRIITALVVLSANKRRRKTCQAKLFLGAFLFSKMVLGTIAFLNATVQLFLLS